jgi:hypothetical protein
VVRRTFGWGLVALVTLVTVVACGGGHKSNPAIATTSTQINQTAGWSPDAISTVKTLVLKIQHAFPGQCADPGLLPHADYLATMQRLHLKIPLAVVDCTGFSESLEFSIFPSASVRATYVTDRTTAICKSAVKGKFNLPGLHWVVGPNFAFEPESEGVSRQVAPVLGGTYQVAPCPGHSSIDWAPAAEKLVEQLAGKLAAAPRVACKGFQLLDRDKYTKIEAYARRLPAAYGTCTAVGNTTIWIAALSASTVTPASFISSETKYQCTTQHGVTGVRGTTWALVAAQVKVAAVAAVATGGTVLPPAC